MGYAAICAFGLAVVVLHGLGRGPLCSAIWGAHTYAFLPLAWFVVGTLLLIAILVWPTPRLPDPSNPRPMPVHPKPRHVGAGLTAVAMGVGCASAAIFHAARVRHLLLGDGLPLTASALAGRGFHPFEPLSMGLQVAVVSWALPFTSDGGPFDYDSAWQVLALVSVLAGGVFAVLVWHIVGDEREPPARSSPTAEPATNALAWLLFLLVMSQGYVLVFFGYVENYALATVGCALYLWSALRYLRGRGSLAMAGLALMVAIGLHFAAVALTISFLALVLGRGSETPQRRSTVRDLIVLVGLGAASVMLVRSFGGYDPIGSLQTVVRSVFAEAAISGDDGLWSLRHLREVANGWVLTGPVGFASSVVMLAVAASSTGFRAGHEQKFLIVLGVTALGVSFLAGDSNLGYARNWDLLAPWGFIAVTASGLAFFRGMGKRHVRRVRAIVAISLFSTVPWIAINASESLALRRFETLPLGFGRTESTLGYWHALRGRKAEAEAWLNRAVHRAPGNTRAWLFLGRLLLEEDRSGEAAVAFDRAVALRPDLETAWRGSVLARWRQGDPTSAASRTDDALHHLNDSATLHAVRGLLFALAGDLVAAASGLERAARLAPTDTLVSEARDLLIQRSLDHAAISKLTDRLLGVGE